VFKSEVRTIRYVLSCANRQMDWRTDGQTDRQTSLQTISDLCRAV